MRKNKFIQRKQQSMKNIMILLILIIGLGYALLSQNLNINGITSMANATWDIHWENVEVVDGSVEANTPVIDTARTTVTYSVILNTPGDFYEFTVDAVNAGTIDGMIESIDSKLNGATITTLPDYLEYAITYTDGGVLEENHELKANQTETYRVRLKYRDDIEINQIPATNQTLSLEFTVKYKQSDPNATKRTSPFLTTLKTDGLSIISFDVDYDKCIEMMSANTPDGVSIEDFCRGEDIEYNNQTINIKSTLRDAMEYGDEDLEEIGLIKNIKYGKMVSYEINHDGCMSFLISMGETDTEQSELFCTGEDATISGNQNNLIELLEDRPEVIPKYESYGLINVTYTEVNPGKTIVGYDGEIPENLVIPSVIDGEEVTGIDEEVFRNKGIRSVIIPSTVTYIGKNAFRDNNLKKVVLGNNNAEVDICAFGLKNSITTNNIPNSYYCEKIYWALQDNDNDNETLVISDRKVNGYAAGSFYGDQQFYSSSDVPWIVISSGERAISNASAYVSNIKIVGAPKPKYMDYWFYYVGENAPSFKANLNNLDVSRTISMKYMLYHAGYNSTTWDIGNLSGWNTSQVTNMSHMLSSAGINATTWNMGDLSSWNTSNVEDMSYMFYHVGYNATTWDIGNLGNWNTSQVTNMNYMFAAAGYNVTTWDIGNLDNWNTSQVTNMSSMFDCAGDKATTWNIGNIGNWSTAKVTDMSNMFHSIGQNATTWDIGNLDNWNTSQVTDMSNMFDSAGDQATIWYIGDLSNWDTSKVTNMRSMFSSAGNNVANFNLNLSNWDTSQVTNMGSMFSFAGENATTFNLNLSGWDTSRVTDMGYMFAYAGKKAADFSLNLGGWGTSKVTNMSNMFQNTGKNSTVFSINIPETNGGGISNTSDKLYGKSTSTYAKPPSSRSFTIMATK